MARIRLSDADRARLGCPEFLPFDLSTITNREAVVLQKLGYATPRLLINALMQQEMDYNAWTAAIWVALRRAGVDVDVETFEYDVFGWDYISDEAEAGKAQTPASPKSSSRSTGAATSRRKSTRTGSPS